MPAAFHARITPDNIHRATGASGRYTRLEKALIEIPGQEAKRRTVMCFGEANLAITRRLVAGRSITLQCEWRNRSLLITGWPSKSS